MVFVRIVSARVLFSLNIQHVGKSVSKSIIDLTF